MEREHYKILVLGKVQGVYFRATAAATARKLGIAGWVKNLPSGQVYMEAEGTMARLDALADWCRKGPALAEVSEVTVEAGEFQGFSGFEVRK